MTLGSNPKQTIWISLDTFNFAQVKIIGQTMHKAQMVILKVKTNPSRKRKPELLMCIKRYLNIDSLIYYGGLSLQENTTNV